MKKLKSWVLMLTLVLTCALPVFADTGYVIDITSDSAVLQGGVYTYSGTFKNGGIAVKDAELSLILRSPDNEVIQINQLNTGATGLISGNYQTSPTSKIGTYTLEIKSTGYDVAITKTFELKEGALLSTIQLNKASYNHGDNIIITGEARLGGVLQPDMTLPLQIKDSNGYLKYIGQVTTNAAGVYSTSVYAASSFEFGVYTASIKVNEYSPEATFSIVNGAGITPPGPVTPPGPPVTPPGKPGTVPNPLADEKIVETVPGVKVVEVIIKPEDVKTEITNAKGNVNIAITTVSPSEVSIPFPTQLMQLANEKNIALAFASNEIEFLFAPAGIQLGTAKEVVLSYKKIEQKSDLTLAEAQGMKSVSPVFDFSLLNKATGKAMTFIKPVEVKITFDAKKVTNPTRLGVYMFNETTKAWEYVGGRVDVANNSITVRLNHFSIYSVMEYNKKFDDLTEKHWGFKNIDALVSKNIMTGVSKSIFAADREIKRSEFVALLVKTLNLSMKSSPVNLKDIKGAWYTSYVEIAASNGIIESTGFFNPNEFIKREDMAVMLSKAMKLYDLDAKNNLETVLDQFSDIGSISSINKESVALATSHGLFNGMNGKFVPSGNATRAQAAAVITQLMGVLDIY